MPQAEELRLAASWYEKATSLDDEGALILSGTGMFVFWFY
jgi:hypothetical protein